MVAGALALPKLETLVKNGEISAFVTSNDADDVLGAVTRTLRLP